jgi:hypothetical protein
MQHTLTATSTETSPLKIPTLANSLGGLFLISYLLCIGFGLLVPGEMRMWTAWAPLLPGFEWLTWRGFLIGAIESYAYGWYVAVVFVPLYRWFAGADRQPRRSKGGQP